MTRSRAVELLLATRNAGKVREIRELTAGRPIAWRSLDEFPALAEAEESGETFAENARAKALYYAQRTGLPALADDSGLEVDALHGAPGVHSAHYAGLPRDDDDNLNLLLERMNGVPAARRTARFRCVMAFVQAGRVILETTGTLEGAIAFGPRGCNGFGYDPVFLLGDRGVTLAELDSAEKNRISHRGQALRGMVAQLPALLARRPM